jgi:Ferritin-like domain
MKQAKRPPALSIEKTPPPAKEDIDSRWQRVVGRRSFLKGIGMASAVLPASGILSSGMLAAAEVQGSKLSRGDAAILRFLAAAELIESDLWTQYAELGGVAASGGGAAQSSEEFQGFTGGNPAYALALENLDGDMPQYITDNTDDELSHAAFLNAYLKSRGAEPVNLDKFRTLPPSKATGADQAKMRLTNLMSLNVDLSWFTRYRSSKNPDFGASINGPFVIKNQPAIPISDDDTPPGQPQPVPPTNAQQSRMQAIANTAGFHFAYIEQGGASLYAAMTQKCSDLEVLRIVVGIGGVEVDHFGLWHDKAGNAVSDPLAGVVDPKTGLTFPNLNAPATELTQTNKILPEPCEFIRKGLPNCSVIRPSSTNHAGAIATVRSFVADNMFLGQSDGFLQFFTELAEEADAAQRRV